MTNKEYLNAEQDDERMKLFLYFSHKEISSMKKIKAFLGSELDLERVNMVKLYSEKA